MKIPRCGTADMSRLGGLCVYEDDAAPLGGIHRLVQGKMQCALMPNEDHMPISYAKTQIVFDTAEHSIFGRCDLNIRRIGSLLGQRMIELRRPPFVPEYIARERILVCALCFHRNSSEAIIL